MSIPVRPAKMSGSRLRSMFREWSTTLPSGVEDQLCNVVLSHYDRGNTNPADCWNTDDHYLTFRDSAFYVQSAATGLAPYMLMTIPGTAIVVFGPNLASAPVLVDPRTMVRLVMVCIRAHPNLACVYDEASGSTRLSTDDLAFMFDSVE